MTRVFKPDPVMVQKARVIAALRAFQETRRAVNDPDAVPDRLDAIIKVVWTVTETIGPEIVTHIDAVIVELEGLQFPVEGDEPLRRLEEKTLTLQGALGNLRRAATSVGYEAPESKVLPGIPRGVIGGEIEGFKNRLGSLSIGINEIKQQQTNEQENDLPPAQAPIVNKVIEKVEINIEIMSIKIDGELIDVDALLKLTSNVASLLVSFADAVNKLGPRVSKWLVKAANEKLRPTAIAFIDLGQSLVTKAETWIKRRSVEEEGASAIGERVAPIPNTSLNPATPPHDFDLEKVREDILAGRAPKSEWCPWIEELDLSGNIHSKDLSILRDMINLERLRVVKTYITHLEYLEPLKKLKYLNISKSVLSEFAAFEKFPNLEILEINEMSINKIRLISKYYSSEDARSEETHRDFADKLKKISLTQTNISEATFINDLKNIEYIDLSQSKISNISFYFKLEKLKYLNISRNPVTKIIGAEYIANLEEFYFQDTLVTSIDFLANLPNIKRVDFSNTKVKNIEALAAISNIQSLDIANIHATSSDVLENLISLSHLNISGIRFYSDYVTYTEKDYIELCFLENLINLTYLNLSNLAIFSLKPLSRLTNLKTIDLRGTDISDISPLAKLKNLESVYVEASRYEKFTSIFDRDTVVKIRE